MKVGDLLQPQLINLELKATSKAEPLVNWRHLMANAGFLDDAQAYIGRLWNGGSR